MLCKLPHKQIKFDRFKKKTNYVSFYSSTDTQFTNRLNNLKGSARNHKNSENTKNNLNFERSIQSSIQNVNLVQMKEIKAENISTINLDILTANIGAKCKKDNFQTIFNLFSRNKQL